MASAATALHLELYPLVPGECQEVARVASSKEVWEDQEGVEPQVVERQVEASVPEAAEK